LSQKAKKTNQIKEKKYFKNLLKIAIPLIITTSSTSIMTFVDRIMLARYSADALAACLPAGMISFAIVAFFMGTSGYTNVFVANYYGRKKYAAASVALWQGVLLSLVSWLAVLLLIPLGLYFINVSHHDAAVKILERQYFTILTLFGGFTVLNNALSGFFTGQGRTMVTMLANVAGNLLNAVLAYTFIFGKFGMPELGIKGAAIGAAAGGFSITLIYFYLILFAKSNRKFKVAKLFGFHKRSFLSLVKYGAPNGFGFFMDMISFSIFVFITGNIDKISLAASNIVLALEQVVFMPMLGLAIANQILMGQNVGRKRPETGVRYTWRAFGLGCAYVCVLIILFLAAPEFFTGLFAGSDVSRDMELILGKTVPLMYLLCFFIVGDLLFLVFGDAIRGAGDTHFHMLTTMFCSVVILAPGCYIIASVLNLGIVWTWGWVTIYAWITGLLMLRRFAGGKWRGIDITA
jgi:MATE family multidrug resistance protein